MKTKLISHLLIITFTTAILFACNKSEDTDTLVDVKTEKFDEGTVEMGIFSNNLDLGKLIQKIDFSKPNIKTQFDVLVKNDLEAKAIFDLINNVSNQNPLAALALTLNIAECTYYIKSSTVLGRVTGFGWTMDNYHNQTEDKGSLYYETLTNTTEIAEQDKKIYTHFKPSINKQAGATNDLDLNLYNRKKLSNKEIVAGYECDIYEYTPKQTDPEALAQLHKLIVYTSPLFNKTINFTHPYYLEEDAGILKLDIFLIDDKTPTLVMKPKKTQQRTLNNSELITRTTEPAYTDLTTEWGFKALAITMSGWAILEN